MEFELWKKEMKRVSSSLEHFWYDNGEYVCAVADDCQFVYKKEFDPFEKSLIEKGRYDGDFVIYEMIKKDLTVLIVSFMGGECYLKRNFSHNTIAKVSYNYQNWGLYLGNAEILMDEFIRTSPLYRLSALFSMQKEERGKGI
jgi:hypothetical protein